MLKKFCLSISFLLSIISTIIAEDTYPKEAWVMYATSNYFPLLEVTIASAHTFSSRPVIAVGVNEDIPFSTQQYPRLIKKRIDVNLSDRFSVYFLKPKAILEANVENGVYIDADAVLNHGCDALFDYCQIVQDHPLCPAHEKDAWVLEDAMQFFGAPYRTMHYVHADVIVFSHSCQLFLNEWNSMCLNHPSLGVPVWDETFLNILLWKFGATEQLPTIDPYNAYFSQYLSLSFSERGESPYNYWFVFHGNKNPEVGWSMLQNLKKMHH